MGTRFDYTVLSLGAGLFMVAVWLGLFGTVQAADAKAAKAYAVECPNNARAAEQCKVDKATYIGWRTFNAFCARCHGQDGVGSSFAPSLVQRLKEIDEGRFMNHVVNGYKGEMGVMPAWKNNPNVTPHLTEIYAYLKARSDDVLPMGQPEKIGASKRSEKFSNWD